VSWLAVLVGCVVQPGAPPAWVAPFDGQTAVPEDFEPRIDIRLETADGWPIDLDVIRVVDVGTGEPNTGIVVQDDEGIRFVPDLPWSAGADYVWSIVAPAEQPRGPSSIFPPILVGTASFSTRLDLDLVAVGARDGEVCAVWSRPATLVEIEEWTPELDGEPAGSWALAETDDPAAERGLAGPTVSCVAGHGSQLRLTRGEDVVVTEVSTTEPQRIVTELRRWSP